jgi:hypothetical protein
MLLYDTDACPYAVDAPAAVKRALDAGIKGQPAAVDAIMAALTSWQ